jgi:hypothetical protein
MLAGSDIDDRWQPEAKARLVRVLGFATLAGEHAVGTSHRTMKHLLLPRLPQADTTLPELNE